MNRRPPWISPEQWASLKLWVHEYGVLVVVAAVAAIAAAAYFTYYRPEPHKHGGYITAEVLATFDAPNDIKGFGLVAHVRLPDGTQRSVGTGSLALASEVVDKVCLEKRARQSGKTTYRIVPWRHCEPA